jgi:hypothetical protein
LALCIPPSRALSWIGSGSSFEVRQDMRTPSTNIVVRYLITLVVLSVAGKLSASSITNFTKSVNYVPPPDFFMHDFSKDDFTDLFSYWGSGIQYEEPKGTTILFMLGPSCCFVTTQGRTQKSSPLLPRNPSELRNDFDKNYHGLAANFTNLPPAQLGKTAGYTSVSASTFFTSNNNYFYSCWIQIESNIVVRVEIETASKESLNVASNSLKTLKINQKQILNIVKSSKY